jgi:hypothetical protein
LWRRAAPETERLAGAPSRTLAGNVLGCNRRSGRALQHQELTLNAEQLDDQPAFFGALGQCQRLLDYGKSVGDVPGTAHGFRDLAHEREVAKSGIGLADFDEAGAAAAIRS